MDKNASSFNIIYTYITYNILYRVTAPVVGQLRLVVGHFLFYD